MSEHKTKCDENLLTRSPYINKISNLSSNMVDHSFYTIVHNTVQSQYKNYIQLDPIDISEFNLPEKYVVITTGYTSDTREWNSKSVNEVSSYILSKGYTPVYLGRSYTKAYHEIGITGKFNANYDNGVNLIDKTDLFQAHSIMNSASCTLGIDNGLLHLNGMGQGRAIWGFTSVLPEHRLPYKDGIQGKDCLVVMPTEKELSCIGCQSRMNFADTSHNFTKCFYYDYKCIDMMGSNRWIEKLKEFGI